jgi:DNA-binding PadR family transcriptional regulator
MEHRGLIDADWDLTENKRRAKYYRLTTKGRQELRARTSSWDRYASAVSKVIHATVQPSVS